MNPTRIAFIPPATRDALESYLYRTRSALTPAQAVAAAVALWLEHQKSANSFSLRGYQWKQLFLPEGSCLRMTYKEMTWPTPRDCGRASHGGWINSRCRPPTLSRKLPRP